MHETLNHLNQDHGNVARLLDVIEQQSQQLAAGQAVNVPLLVKSMRYLTQFQDVFHHPREDLVFTRIVAREPGATAQINGLLAEHETLATLGTGIYGGLRAIAGDDTIAGHLAAALNDYCAALRNHMRAESESVFPLAEVILSSSDWGHVKEALAVPADPLFGPAAEKAYTQILEQIGSGRRT